MDNMSFSQHGKVEENENDIEIIELSSDDDTEQPSLPQQQQQPQNYNRSMDSSAQNEFQFKTEIVHDSVHVNTMNQYMDDAYQDDGIGAGAADSGPIIEDHFSESYLSEESDGDDFLKNLKAKHHYNEQTVQTSPRYLMDMARTSAPSPPAASSAMVTSTTAAMTPAHTSTSTPSPLPNFSTESQSNLDSCINAEVNQNITSNLSFDELFKHTDPQAAQVMAQYIDSKVKEHMQTAMNHLKQQFDFVPKGSNNDDDSKAQKRKHRHLHKSEKNAANSRHGHDYRSMKREKLVRSSSESSIDDFYGPSTSTPNYSAGKNNRNSSGKSGAYKKPTGSSSSPFAMKTGYNNGKFRFGNDFSFGRSKPQTQPIHKVVQKKQIDYGAVKNVDKSLYLTSEAAKKCPLCDKKYKRMVNHFRKDHMNYEVFVSRLSSRMATTLIRSNLPVTKYARASKMQFLKMMCPFCECEKDFFVPYWSNHIRTHTGEYTNECIVCLTTSLSATHCGQSTIKQKCNLNEDGLSAYLCTRCNWVQIDKNRVIQHMITQHGIVGNAYQNEYQKITIIPALNKTHDRVNPRNAIAQSLTAQHQQPLFAANDRPSASVSSTGIQVLENVVVQPSILNSIAGASATGFDNTFYGMADNSQMDTPFSDGLNLISQANQMLNDGNDDIQMLGEFPTGQDNSANTYEMIKVDTIDDQALQKVFDSYNEVDTNSFVVRPWMDVDACKLCIDEICQFALYKCMYQKCVFATNSMENWQIHMGAHVQVIDLFQKKDLLLKTTRDKLIMYRECPYCCFTAKADHQVLRHIEEDHRRSIFQCAMCYYRTIEMDNMVLHMQGYHPEAKEVLLCGETLEFLQQDEEILIQDCENYVKKIQCGQGGCGEEYACYNNLYAHLVEFHSGTYLCPYCSQTMGLDEPMIVDHLKNCGFPEFECLKCHESFHDVHAIREHMSMAHPSNYLFVGARRTKQPCEDQDEIQVIHIGGVQNTIPYSFIKCADPSVLDGMDPKELITDRQLNDLKKLRMANPCFRSLYNGHVPRIEKTQDISVELMQYSDYAKLNVRQDKKSVPLSISFKCITNELMNELPTIANFIDREKDIDQIDCTMIDITNSLAMLRHRLKKHALSSVFLQTEQQLPFTVHKIVHFSFQCLLCAGKFSTRMELRRHFHSVHSNCWIAAKISVKSEIIESNDPQQPIGRSTEAIDYFYRSILKCSQSDCSGFAGTRAEAIVHYNDEHRDDTVGSQIDKFQATMAEHIIAHNENEIEPYLKELKSHDQMHLLECQHCWKLFDSLAAINDHFVALRTQNIQIKCRFLMKRLYCCLGDNTVCTLDGMKRYANTHPNGKSIVPVNMQLPTSLCGLCRYNFKSKGGDLPTHFREKHVKDNDWCRDAYNDAFLKSLNLGEIQINQCQFALDCCNIGERILLSQIVDHLLNCERRFRCNQCPEQKFTSTVSFVTHYIDHVQNVDSSNIFDELHDFKAFLLLFVNMQIILPNGLVVVMHEIHDTLFGIKLKGEIGRLAQEAWEREKTDLSLMTII